MKIPEEKRKTRRKKENTGGKKKKQGRNNFFLVGVEVTRLKFFLFRFDLSLLAPAPTDDFVGDEVTSL